MSSTISALTSGGGIAIAGDTSGQLQLLTNNGTTAVTIDTSQNVGIGTASPSTKLQVNSTADCVTIQSSAIAGYANVNFNNTVGTQMFGMGYANTSAAVASGTGYLYTGGATPITFFTSATERMRITSTGDVGIGTATPTQSWTGGSAKVQQLQGGSSQITVLRVNESSGTYGDLQLISSGSAEIGVYNFSNGAMRFGTNGTERMRIDSSGRLLVAGTSTISYGSGSNSRIQAYSVNGSWSAIATAANSTSSTDAIDFFNPNGRVGSILTNGSNTTYNTSSDYRLKEDIAPMIGALATVTALKPCTYKWKVDGSSGQGFIAHELQALMPDAVTGEKDAVDAEDNPVYQGVDTSFLVATLTAAIQELNAKVDAQAAEIQALKGVA